MSDHSELPRDGGLQVTVSGHCPACSFYRRPPTYVFHGVPWCVDVPAIVRVDWNGPEAGEDEHGKFYDLYALWPSRPVVVGEGVIWIDEFPMTGRGIVTKVRNDPDKVPSVYIRVYDDWHDFAEMERGVRTMLSTDPRVVTPWKYPADTEPSEGSEK